MNTFTKLGLVLKSVAALKEDWERLTDTEKLFRITQIETALEIVRDGQ